MTSHPTTYTTPLHREGSRRRRGAAFAALSKGAAEALSRDDLEPLAEACQTVQATSDDVLFSARVHGVSGLLARLGTSRTPIPKGLPDGTLEELQHERQRIKTRGERLQEDFYKLGNRASRSGLPLIPLKGTYLTPERYRDLSLRPSADIDLLTPPHFVADWSRLLLEEGYILETQSEKDRVFTRPGARVAGQGYEENEDNPRPVELHHAIRQRLLGRTVDITELYTEGLVDGNVLGLSARIPMDDALAVHLLHHAAPAAIGRGLRLIQIYDFRTISPGIIGAVLASSAMGSAAWGVASLLERSLPGVLPALFREGLRAISAIARDSKRQAAWQRRPGLMTGREERTILALAELPLCEGPAAILGRLRAAIPPRTVLNRLYGQGGASSLLQYVRERIRP